MDLHAWTFIIMLGARFCSILWSKMAIGKRTKRSRSRIKKVGPSYQLGNIQFPIKIIV